MVNKRSCIFYRDLVHPKLSREDRRYLIRDEIKWRVQQKRKRRGRVIGGTDVTSNTEFPEYVAVWANVQNQVGVGTPDCGGFILDRYHIMTAAHCGKERDFITEKIYPIDI